LNTDITTIRNQAPVPHYIQHQVTASLFMFVAITEGMAPMFAHTLEAFQDDGDKKQPAYSGGQFYLAFRSA